MESTARYLFLDWLRVLAIAVLLFFHTGMLFVGWRWHLMNAETIPALRLPMDIAHRLRMPLLFVIAGAGLWFAAQRRSGAELLGERTQRLLVPAIAGMFLIVPPQVFIERVASGEWRGGYWAFFVQRVLRFEPYPTGDFSWHHLWFIVYLYVYVLLLLPFVRWWRRSPTALKPGAWLYLLALPLGINEALLKPAFPETHNLVRDWYIFNHYLLLTLYGVVLASMRGGWDWFAARRRTSLAVALVLLAGGLALFERGIIARDTAFDALFANVFTWVWLAVFLGYGRQHLSGSNRWLVGETRSPRRVSPDVEERPNAERPIGPGSTCPSPAQRGRGEPGTNWGHEVLVWSRDASYPIYILHQTVIIAVAFFVVGQPWSPWSKYWLVLAATLAICVLLYECVLRRLAIARVLFGIKTREAPPRAPPPVQLPAPSPQANTETPT